MNEDFPAAHSMDTTWFAVDRDGNVGRFETGEDGAVPNDAPCSANIDTVDDFLIHAAALVDAIAKEPSGPPRTFDRDQRAMAVIEPPLAEPSSYRNHPAGSSSDPIANAIVLRETGPRVIASPEPLSPKKLAELADRPDVRVLWTSTDVWDRIEELSMFVFRNGGDEPGEYVRGEVPAKPLALSGLPKPVKDEIGLALPVRFADVDRIHLADHMKDEDAQMWGEGISLRGEPKEGFAEPVPEPAPRERPVSAPAKRPVDWIRIVILLAAVLGIAYLVSRK